MITDRYVNCGALTIFCESFGNSMQPAVLLISGAGAPCVFWTDSFCRRLSSAGYFVIRFDHRDSGLSSAIDFEKNPYSVMDLADDALKILDSFSIKKAHVVGHSMGGTIAQLLALSHPDRVLTYTSISVPPLGTKIEVSKETMAALLENVPTQNFEESLLGFMRSWKLLNGDYPLDEEIAKDYTKDLYVRTHHPVGVAWNHIRSQEKLKDFSKELCNMQVSGLFLHGGKDSLVRIKDLSNSVKGIPFATFEIIPHMGHMMFHEGLQESVAKRLLLHFKIK